MGMSAFDTAIAETCANPKKLLIITSSGGGGLIQTANAKEQEALARDPTLLVTRVDLLKDWVPFSQFFINFWNHAQQKGNIFAQMICVRFQFLVDLFLFPSIFLYALRTLFREDVDLIIDTQPMGTSAVVWALKIFNRKRGKSVRVEKVLVDLPTHKATHFFSPIRRLSKENRKLVQLVSIAPLLEKGETAEEFWQKTCGLSCSDIHYEEPYVRQAFLKYKGKGRSKSNLRITVRYKLLEELELMKKTFKRGSIGAEVHAGEVLFSIEPEDRVFTILLGSQPAKDATLAYVKKLIDFHQNDLEKTHIFVFCADHEIGVDTLYQKLSRMIASFSTYPSNISVIPMSFQKEDVIAALFHRSDATWTRSGGQTAMELMSVSTGRIFIHSEAKNKQDLLKGIPGWESESAVYLQKMYGAKIVTPDTLLYCARVDS